MLDLVVDRRRRQAAGPPLNYYCSRDGGSPPEAQRAAGWAAKVPGLVPEVSLFV
jgi:hypothetical protein